VRGKPVILVSGQGWVEVTPEMATHLTLRFPGPVGELTLPVMIGGTRKGTHNWTWNGDVNKPTLKPSIKTEMWVGENSCHEDGCPGRKVVFHSHMNDGRAEFLNDTTEDVSTQGLRGQSVEMLDV